MGTRMACVTFSDGTQMYTKYTTVTDHCFREILPATDEAQRLDVVSRKYTGLTWEDYQVSFVLLDAGLPEDVEAVRVTVPGYDDTGWATTASRTRGLVVGPTSAEWAAAEREKGERRLRVAYHVAQSTKPRYVVRDRTGHVLRETDSKLAAWLAWFRGRRDGATAHDRRSWIEDEKRWLRCGDLPPEQRAN